MDSRKPLTAGEIEELAHVNREIQDCGGVWLDYQASKIVNALPRLLSLLTPPPDAAVREAVEWLNKASHSPATQEAIRTLLRAVQAARETRALPLLGVGV